MTRHHRRRTPEPAQLVTPGATPRQIKCDHALAPFDKAARDMERKWGIDRLPSLVSPALAARWSEAMANLNAATASENPEEIIRHADAAIRGLAVLDAEAEKSGATRFPEIWEYDDGQGFRFGIMPDNFQWQAAKEQRPDLALFTMREVSMALKGIDPKGLLTKVKQTFPGSEVSSVRHKPLVPLPDGFWQAGGDPIPF